MKRLTILSVLILSLLLAAAFVFTGCDDEGNCKYNDDDDDDSTDDDDSVDDDDATDDDDDDDDDSDDDDDDDYTCDDFVPPHPPDPGVTRDGIFYQMVDGGAPGKHGHQVGVLPDGRVFIAGFKGNILRIYTLDDSKGWTTEMIARFATGLSVAVGSTGDFHLTYFDIIEENIHYATNASGTWEDETVGSASTTVLVLDSNDNPHIAYRERGAENLKYAVKAGGTWNHETVESGMDVNYYPTLALDSAGYAHIGFMEPIQGDDRLHYATNKTGTWSTEPVGRLYGKPEILVDGDDDPHLFYITSEDKVNHATNETGSWVETAIFNGSAEGLDIHAVMINGAFYVGFQHVDAMYLVSDATGSWVAEEVFEFSYNYGLLSKMFSLTRDSDDHLHFSLVGYNEENPDEGLRYATNASGMWSLELVDKGWIYFDVSLATDSSGMPYMSYQYDDPSNQGDQNVYGKVAWIEDSVWHSTCFGDGRIAAKSGLDVDSEGLLSIVANDNTNNMLAYFKETGGAFEKVKIHDNPDVYRLSIQVDSNDFVHAFYSTFNYDYGTFRSDAIEYATNKNGFWTVETVEDDSYENLIYTSPAFGLDMNGAGHGIYRKYIDETESNSIMYAHNVSGTWETSKIDTELGYFDTGSLVLDSEGTAHISYWSRDSQGTRELIYGIEDDGLFIKTIVDRWDIGGADEPVGNHSIALDEDNHVHLLYHVCEDQIPPDFLGSEDPCHLKYATNESGTWEYALIGNEIGQLNSVDYYHFFTMKVGNGQVHVAHARLEDGVLWYLRFPEGYQN